MKKIQLNKQIIASLDNPNRIYGGDDRCKLSEYSDGNGWPRATCGIGVSCEIQKTCDGHGGVCQLD